MTPRIHALLIAILVAGLAIVAIGFSRPTGASGVAAAVDACGSSASGHLSERPTPHSLGPTATAPGARAPAEAVPVLLALDNETNWTAGGFACYDWNVAWATAGLTFGDTQLRVKTDLCAAVPEGVGIQYLNAAGTPVATENVTLLQWSPSPAGSLLTGDSLLLSATGPLTQDQLDTNVTGTVGGTPWEEGTGMQIVPYSGDWEGCSF